MAKTGATLDSGARHPRIRSNFGEAILGARARLSANRQRGQGMAEQEMKAANETYAGFLNLLKVGTIASVIAAIVVVLLIS